MSFSRTRSPCCPRLLAESFIVRDLHRRRNMRLAFKNGFFRGGLAATAMTLTGGRFPGGRVAISSDAAVPRRVGGSATPVVSEGLSKVDAVFRADNATRDDIPLHVTVPSGDVPQALGELYEHLCPAGVYEWRDGELVVNAPNCVDCKATDVLGPRWHPREGGSGPSYKLM